MTFPTHVCIPIYIYRILFLHKLVGFTTPCFLEPRIPEERFCLAQVQSMRPHKFADGRNPNNQCLGRQGLRCKLELVHNHKKNVGVQAVSIWLHGEVPCLAWCISNLVN